MGSNSINEVPIKVKKVERPTYTVDRSKLRRFHSRNTVFGRARWDTSWKGYVGGPFGEKPRMEGSKKRGYSMIDFALARASRAVERALRGGFSQVRNALRVQGIPRGPFSMAGKRQSTKRIDFDNPHEASVYIKSAAKFFGASLVGICKLNRDWLYADAEVSEKFENVIVMAIEMDAEAIASSPAPLASAATGVGYSKMAFTLTCMGDFIRNLGYDAIQCGNDTALSIPLAIDAGLGELGRNGLLITPQYGPRVRLCKILTDLPLEPDKPIEFGVREFCEKCKICAKNCEAGAISMEDKPSYRVACRSNNPGALKWYVNVEKCFLFWRENGTSCSTCIKVCPFNLASVKRAKANLR